MLSLASPDSSGSNCSLSLGKIFSGEQVGLGSVGRRHSGLLEKGTKDWPERTRRMQTPEISQSGRPDCDVAVGGQLQFPGFGWSSARACRFRW